MAAALEVSILAEGSSSYYNDLNILLKSNESFDGDILKCTKRVFLALKRKTLQALQDTDISKFNLMLEVLHQFASKSVPNFKKMLHFGLPKMDISLYSNSGFTEMCKMIPELIQCLTSFTSNDTLKARIEICRVLNGLLVQYPVAKRALLLSQQYIYDNLVILGEWIHKAGDFEFQQSLLECIFRLTDIDTRHELISHCFNRFKLTDQCRSLRQSEFEIDSRYFLNNLNKACKTNRSVYSFPCHEVKAGYSKLPCPLELDEFWVDFNVSSTCVSFCTQAEEPGTSSDETVWESVHITNSDVKSWNINTNAVIEVKLILYQTHTTVFTSPDITLIMAAIHLHDITQALNKTFGNFKSLPIQLRSTVKQSIVSNPIKISLENRHNISESNVDLSPIFVNEHTPAVNPQLNSQENQTLKCTSTPKLHINTVGSSSVPTTVPTVSTIVPTTPTDVPTTSPTTVPTLPTVSTVPAVPTATVLTVPTVPTATVLTVPTVPTSVCDSATISSGKSPYRKNDSKLTTTPKLIKNKLTFQSDTALSTTKNEIKRTLLPANINPTLDTTDNNVSYVSKYKRNSSSKRIATENLDFPCSPNMSRCFKKKSNKRKPTTGNYTCTTHTSGKKSTSDSSRKPSTTASTSNKSFTTSNNKPTTTVSHKHSATVSTGNKPPTTVSTSSKPTTVSTGNRPTTVSTGNRPTTVSTGNRPTTVSTGNRPTTVSTGNRPTTVSTGNRPTTVSTGNRPTTVSTSSKPTTVSTSHRPTTVSTGNKEFSISYVEESQPSSTTNDINKDIYTNNMVIDRRHVEDNESDTEESFSSNTSDITWKPDTKSNPHKSSSPRRSSVKAKDITHHKVHFKLDNQKTQEMDYRNVTSPNESVVSSTTVCSSDVGPDPSILSAFHSIVNDSLIHTDHSSTTKYRKQKQKEDIINLPSPKKTKLMPPHTVPELTMDSLPIEEELQLYSDIYSSINIKEQEELFTCLKEARLKEEDIYHKVSTMYNKYFKRLDNESTLTSEKKEIDYQSIIEYGSELRRKILQEARQREALETKQTLRSLLACYKVII